MITTFSDPFGHLEPHNCARIHASVSIPCYSYLFKGAFPLRGAQDRVVAQLLQKFEKACKDANIPNFHNQHNEQLGQELLNSLTFNPEFIR
jgi:hypothetical protein